MRDTYRQKIITWLRESEAELLDQHPALESRIEQFFDDFFQPYERLYGDRPEFNKNIHRLFRQIAAGLRKRNTSLLNIDRLRSEDPHWFQDERMIGMMMYVDLFAGDILGLDNHIDYLRELGVTYLHLMPLLATREGQNDGGYAVTDFRKVNPRLGTMRQLRKLARDLHHEGISLVIDFVMNHTAREHSWAQKALQGSAAHQDFYLLYDSREMPDAYEETLAEIFPDFAPGNFTYVPSLQKWAWTTFYDFQWDLNYANPRVFEAMLGEMIYLANAGADVLRLDAVPFLWKRLGTNCQNQIEAVVILAAYRALMRIFAPAVAFKAEAIVAPEDIMRYLGVGGFEGKVCDIAYNATLMNHLWHAMACENTHLLRTTLSNLPKAPPATTWINYIRCHDDIGWGITDENAAAVNQPGRGTRRFCVDFYSGDLPGSYAEGYRFQVDPVTAESRVSGTAAALAGLQKAIVENDDEAADAAIRRLLLMNAIIFFMRGIPLIYSGDEIGQLNDYAYLDDIYKRSDNRWVHRPPMNWRRAEARHVPGTPEYRLFHGIRRLTDARRELRVLHGDSSQEIILVDSDSLFVVERKRGDDSALMVANVAGVPRRIDLGKLPRRWISGRYVEAIMNEPVHFTFGDLAIGPYECLWLVQPRSGVDDETVRAKLQVRVETQFGENVYITGNVPKLGEWRSEHAFGPLSPDRYPLWEGEVSMPLGTVFEYTWMKKRDGRVVETGRTTHFQRAGRT